MKNSTLLIAVVIFLLCSTLTAGVKGILLDIDNNPLPYLTVHLQETGDTFAAGMDGTFILPVEAGTYTLRILDQEMSVYFEEGAVAKVQVLIFSQTISARLVSMETIAVDSQSIERSSPGSITDLLSKKADIHQVGMGGALATVTIGGFSRHRIQTTVNGYRVTGDRRAGSDLGTVIPSLLEGVNVFRGETSMTHGSGAMGGVLDITLPTPDTGEGGILLGGSFEENNDRRQLSFRLDQPRFTVAAAFDEADEYTTPAGSKEPGFYSRENFYAGYRIDEKEKRFTLVDLFYSRASDIGKPSTSSKPTIYPEDILALGGIRSLGTSWNYQAGVIYQELSTEKTSESSQVRSLNIQGSILYHRGRFNAGFHLYTRQGVDSEVVIGEEVSHPLDGASRWEAAPVVSYKINLSEKVTLGLGTRVQVFRASSGTGSQIHDIFPTANLRFSWLQSQGDLSLSVFQNYRFPTLEELYYTGPTGRGFIEGNEMLNPETGLGAGVTWRRMFREFHLEAACSLHEMDEYIERVNISDDLYTFRNSQNVRILDAAVRVSIRDLALGLSWARGEDRETGDPVDDIPPFKVSFNYSPEFGRISPFLHVVAVRRQDSVGPSENEIPGYAVIDAGVFWEITESWSAAFRLKNLLDKAYFPSADEKAVFSPGRSAVLSMKYFLPLRNPGLPSTK